MTTKKPTCQLISTTDSYHGKQGLDYQAAVSAESVGAEAICMHLVTIPPGAQAKAHLHENHETAIYMLQGTSAMWYGENLEEHMVAKAGDFIYIPAGMPHLPYNPSDTEPAVAVLSRTDPNEQESVVLRPDLEKPVDRKR
ncbi:MAG: cupin domain-containing protein [Chloroflexota bacterium]